MKKIATIGLFTILLTAKAFGGNSNSHGNRMVLLTYWGDDKIALVDIQGDPGHEEVWAIDTLKTAGCAKPYDIRSNQKGDEAYVSCSGSDKIAVVDVLAQQVKYTVKTGLSPRDLALFNSDSKLLVANSGSDTATVVDLKAQKKLYDFDVSSQPYGVAVTKDGKTALITGWASGDLHTFQLGDSSAKEIGKVDVGLLPYTVVIPNDGDKAYVAANASHAVSIVDVPSTKLLARVSVGRNPWSLAASPDGKQVLVTNNRSNNLSLLKTGLAPMAVGKEQTFIAAGAQEQPNGESVNRAAKNASISSDGKTGAFTDLANNQLCIVDLASGKITKVINVGKAPYGIEFLK
ncbi:YncE family protein [Paraburkholderia sp. BR10882]|uniref:YncE family protein n=1 Tax=unclassified Paraburkholderia TaxID=2615204 RepID=UPI0034CE3F4A